MVVIPESVSLGSLSSANAVKMVILSIYSDVARKSGIEGKVIVEVSLDTKET